MRPWLCRAANSMSDLQTPDPHPQSARGEWFHSGRAGIWKNLGHVSAEVAANAVSHQPGLGWFISTLSQARAQAHPCLAVGTAIPSAAVPLKSTGKMRRPYMYGRERPTF